MKRIKLDDDLYEFISQEAIKDGLLTRSGRPAINRYLKRLFLKRGLKWGLKAKILSFPPSSYGKNPR